MFNRSLLTVAAEDINMFPGYTSYHSLQERRREAGVSVFINIKIETNQLQDHSFKNDFLEFVRVNVKKGSKGYVHLLTRCFKPLLTFFVAR